MAAFADANFFAALDKRVAAVDSLLCIGLDPHSQELREGNAFEALKFCKEIIDATHPYAACYKPNCAFFEAFGAAGISALIEVLRLIPRDIPVILDCKRGDIDTTAAAYARSAYDVITPSSISAVTLSPYMGWDSIKPFVTGVYSNRGAFVLCKTSNPSSADLQGRTLSGGQHIYEGVLDLCNTWNAEKRGGEGGEQGGEDVDDKNPRVGVVAGATDLVALARIRSLSPSIWILCPGVGAQGGDAASVCNAALRTEDASGLLVAVSRGISRADDKTAAAKSIRDQVNESRNVLRGANASKKAVAAGPDTKEGGGERLLAYQERFIDLAIDKQALRFGDFSLKSGRLSPYFFNAGMFSCGRSASMLSKCYAECIRASGVEFDVIFGPAYKGIPLAAGIAAAWWEMYHESKEYAYNRKEAKDHGEGGTLVGAVVKGRKVLIVDDVITAGTAIRESVAILKAAEAVLVGVAVSLDRQEKPTDSSTSSAIQQVEAELKVPVVAVVRLKHILSYLLGASVQSAAESAANTRKVDAIRLYREKYGVNY
jgi:uridine monophosphate synthetase